MPVDVRGLVDGDTVDGDLEIGPMDGVEATEEKLRPFALAAVLHHEDTGYEPEGVLGRAMRDGRELPCRDDRSRR